MQLAGDGDVEVSVNAVSLRCPLTAMRIKTPAHFTTAPGLAYFDLGPFLELTQRSGKWQVGAVVDGLFACACSSPWQRTCAACDHSIQ